ncbi:MAG: Mur ligase family protein [Prolixibacteraceae bacterium]|nr:Mur ligase family protein [Prolixibacteraceae bacterium]
MMKIHFIAIGGSAMHNLALALYKKGFTVTGSDDEIVEPSRSRLAACGLLPEAPGWFPAKITAGLDAIVLGMHARGDNPELVRARELGVKILSYPEFLYEQTRDKIRVVIGGSHGKTTITSMIMHVLRESGMAFDYMVGAQLDGFDTMVGLSNDSRIAVFEGDEYLSSPEDRRPKFHLYHPHIGVLSGIAWDHINVFPTFENYVDQFRRFAELIEPGGRLFYFNGDPLLREIAAAQRHITCTEYQAHPAEVRGQQTFLISGDERIPLRIFGEHNLQNISAAQAVCHALGVGDERFYQSIGTFTGAARRLEVLAENSTTAVFRDFAHSPSKLKATTRAVKNQFPGRRLIACMELHTFSSLKKEFLPHYHHTMNDADEAYVYFNPHTVEHKKLEPITSEMVSEGFGTPGLRVTTDAEALFATLETKRWENANLLLMSSGNFNGLDLHGFARKITGE